MQRLYRVFDHVDQRITHTLADYSIPITRIGLGIVFFWFGFLKFFPGLSPAQELATRTIEVLTFGFVPAAVSLPILAAWECLIGLGLITGKLMRVTILLLLMQMAGAVMPLFLFPGEAFQIVPYAPTLEGQYIIKNVVLVAAGLVIGSTVRGGRVVSEPARIINHKAPEAEHSVATKPVFRQNASHERS